MSLSLKTNTGFLSGAESRKGTPLLFSSADRSSSFVASLRDENKQYELTHNQPISVGITVSKSLNDRLSLETGVMFTYLYSKIKSDSERNIKERQEFGYLGVPLYLNYNFYNLEKAKFYLSLGVMAQKDVFGKYTSSMSIAKSTVILTEDKASSDYYSQPEPSFKRENISQSNWQFSSHLTVGASYPIYQKLKVYTSIGGAYYFDAKNEHKTIYSDRKLQLDLNLGLRFDF